MSLPKDPARRCTARNRQGSRMAPDGVHATVAADDPQHPHDTQTGKPYRHSVYIPVRDNPDDQRTTRIRPVRE